MHGQALERSLWREATIPSNYLVYEHWADEFGYDPDSRKGEKIYEECRLQASKLSDVLGGMDKVQNLREILQELDCQPATPRMKPRF